MAKGRAKVLEKMYVRQSCDQSMFTMVLLMLSTPNLSYMTIP